MIVIALSNPGNYLLCTQKDLALERKVYVLGKFNVHLY